MVATATTYPFDLTRTQFALQGNDRLFVSMTSFMGHTVSKHGVSGLFTGLPVALVGIMPYMGLNFALYESAKRILPEKKQLSASANVAFNGACGAFAGGLSKFAVFPLDTIKKRMQASILHSSFEGNVMLPQYKSIRHCIQHTIQHEGLKGLYKGIVPTTLKSVFGTAVAFAAFEVLYNSAISYQAPLLLS
jgi:solute carrier family 25 thiamine pyrophosphate transporter 19